VIARCLLLLIGVLVLLIHDDQAERFHRRKNGRPRANDDARPPLSNFMPLVVPLTRAQMRMQHRHQRLQFSRAEPRLEPLDGLRRQGNFWHEDDRALALFQRVGDRLEINFRLAGAGDAIQEERAVRRRLRGSRGRHLRFVANVR